jgi:hypothetical protein
MMIDRQRFFSTMRGILFGGKLTVAQVRGTEMVLDMFQQRAAGGDVRHLAYALATAFHETGATMQPVRETMAPNDDAAIGILDRAFAAGRLGQVKVPYWRRDAEGKSWLGRGLVQLTHRRNYEAMSAVTGIDLVEKPQRAMEPQVSALILVEGMMRGSFTGRRLSHYFSGVRADWEGARAIINGTDRADLVAGYGRAFHMGLTASRIEQAAVG